MLYSETELKKRLKSGCPVFYFYASDEALVRSAAAKAEKFLSEEAPDTTTLDGPTPSVEDIVLAAGTISFFGGRRLVMLPLIRPSAYSDKDLQELCDTLSDTENAVFVLTSLLEEKYGMSAEVIDARSLVPFNYEKVLASVKKTGRIVIAGDATARGSFLNDLARNITELAFDYLDAPAVVLGSRDWITPAYELEYAFFPQPDSFLDIIHEKIVPLQGYVPTRNYTDAEQIRRAKEGI